MTKNMARTHIAVGVVLCLVLVLCCGMTGAQEADLQKPLVASGVSPLLQQDTAEARDLALQEALRSAVEQGLGWLLPARRLVRFYPLLLERILTQPMNYVQDYQIVHEGQRDQLYQVTVQTRLYTGTLTRDLRQLGLFLEESERPRVALLVAERFDPQAPWRWWWKTPPEGEQHLPFSSALVEQLSKWGLIPLTPQRLLSQVPPSQTYQMPLLDHGQAVALGRALGAELVVSGQATLKPANPQRPAMASASLRALKTGTGELLARASATIEAQPSEEDRTQTPEFTALAERLVPQLAEPMLAPYTRGIQAPRDAVVQVSGVRSYSDLLRIKEFLQEAPGVKTITQIQLQPGQGVFSVVLAGNLDDLSRLLDGHDFGRFVTSAESTGSNSIHLRVFEK